MSSRKLLSEEFRRGGWDVYEVSSIGGDDKAMYEIRPLPGYENNVWEILQRAETLGLRFDPSRPLSITNWEEWSATASGVLAVTTFVAVNLSGFRGNRGEAKRALEEKCSRACRLIGDAVRDIVEGDMGIPTGAMTSSTFSIEFYGDDYTTELDKVPF